MAIILNPNSTQLLDRNIGRIKTLKLAIANTNDEARKDSLQVELDRRLDEAKRIQDELNSALSEDS